MAEVADIQQQQATPTSASESSAEPEAPPAVAVAADAVAVPVGDSLNPTKSIKESVPLENNVDMLLHHSQLIIGTLAGVSTGPVTVVHEIQSLLVRNNVITKALESIPSDSDEYRHKLSELNKNLLEVTRLYKEM